MPPRTAPAGCGPPAPWGFFGKIPSRGDFVHRGLPSDLLRSWDAWTCRALPESRRLLAAGWLPAWMEAPVWRFVLAPNACGAAAVLGLWLPSVDRAGRPFPLLLAACLAAFVAETASADVRASAAETALTDVRASDWLDAAEAAGRAALADDLSPEALSARLPPPPPAVPAAMAGWWWTQGAPRVTATRLRLPGLPAPEGFAAMLCDPAPAPGGGR